MLVGEFSHTDNGSTWTVQRTVSGGVTLSQVTDASLLTDGPNTVTADINLDSHNLVHMNNPENNPDAAHKYYVLKLHQYFQVEIQYLVIYCWVLVLIICEC